MAGSESIGDGGAGRPSARVDLWYVAFADLAPPEASDRLLGLLSADEVEAMGRLVFARDRHAYLLAHAMVRLALSRELGAPPGAWRFSRGPLGKPLLVGPGAVPAGLDFSLSHAGGLAVCAVGPGPLGADVEPIAHGRVALAAAPRAFSGAERARLARLAGAEAEAAALELWTLKEAFLKALGLGLAADPRGVSLVVPGAGPASLEPAASLGEDPARWHLARLRIGDHVAAVAARGGAGGPPLIRAARMPMTGG